MNATTNTGKKVKYIGYDKNTIGADPRHRLYLGKDYTIAMEESRSAGKFYKLEGYPGLYFETCFEDVEDLQQPYIDYNG